MSETLIGAQDIRKSFNKGGREISVLDGLSFELQKNETVAILGASGVGKTTFLHAIGLLADVDAGRLTVMGNDCGAMDAERKAELRNRFFGYIFQFHHLLPEFTALENVLMPVRIAQGTVRDEDMTAARDLLGLVGMDHRLEHRPTELSGGEQQRVAFVRAMMLGPKVVLADEPTGNLDVETEKEVIDLMFELIRRDDQSLVLITHNRELVSRCDRVLRMKNGRLEEEVSP